MASMRKRQEIVKLLLLFGFSMALALFLTVFLIYNYGPSGRYLVSSALLAPDLTSTLAYNDTNKKTGGLTRYISDGIELSFYNPKTKEIEHLQIDLKTYRHIYGLIDDDESVQELTEQMIQQFSASQGVATLAIKVRTESHADWIDETKDFQTVEFARDFFRIRLHEEKNPNIWVYFAHSQILQQVMRVAIP